MFHVMGRIFSLSTVVLLTLVETVENPAEPSNDAEVAVDIKWRNPPQTKDALCMNIYAFTLFHTF